MKIFDILAGLLLIASGVMGLWRGAVQEVVKAVAFFGAAAVALYGLRYTRPVAERWIDPPWLAAAAAVLAVFILINLALSLLGSAATRSLEAHSALNALNRGAGFALGLVRACLVLGLFNLLFNAVTPPARAPQWVTGAALYPLSTASAKLLKVFAPKAKAMTAGFAPVFGGAAPEGAASKANEGYSVRERRRLDDLVESTR